MRKPASDRKRTAPRRKRVRDRAKRPFGWLFVICCVLGLCALVGLGHFPSGSAPWWAGLVTLLALGSLEVYGYAAADVRGWSRLRARKQKRRDDLEL